MAEQWLLPDGTPWLLEDGTYWLDEGTDTGPPVVIPDPPGGQPLPVWSLDLCRGWVKIAEAGAFTFQGVERFNAPGEWSLEVAPAGISEWSPTGNFVDGEPVMYGPGDVDSVILWRDDEVAFPGMVSKVSDGVGGFDNVKDGTGDTYKWSGSDLWGVLRQGLTFPNPAVDVVNSDPTPWAVAYDTRTGSPAAVLAAYIYDNMGDGALTARRYSGLTVENLVPTGTSATFTTRLQYLDALAERMANDDGFRVRMQLDTDLTVTVVLDVPLDLSPSVVISDQGDLSNVVLRRVPRGADWVLAAGSGEGTARNFQVASTTTMSGRRRIEVLSDQSSLTVAELLKSAVTTLRLGAPTWSIDATVTDNLARTLRYGRDLRCGDLITVEVDGARYPVPVVSAVFEISPERQQVRPQLGTGTPDVLRGLLRDVANLADRFDRNVA